MVTPSAAYASAVPPPGNRPNSIAVFGATGNAGRAVAYHAVKSAVRKPNVRVALSGRNRDKIEKVLEGIRDELRSEGIKSDDTNVEIIIADASDEQSMLNLAKSTNVLVSCAGPYGRYGEAAVKACVEGGAHYVDITGEQPFVERMINDYGKSAEESGVLLAPFSGYDCVPCELGMWLVGKALEEEGIDTTLGQLELNFGGKGGGFPRGTLETVLDGIEGKAPPRKEGTPRFYDSTYKTTAKDALSLSHWVLPKYQMGQFTGPNFMSAVNVPVLCRAAPKLGFSSDLTISDKSVLTGSPSLLNCYGLFQAQIYIATLVFGGVALSIPPVRGWLRNKLKTYSFNGDAAGKVFLEVKGSNKNSSATAKAKCMFPGDAGIYATGLFAMATANSLLEATSSDSTFPMPPAGFHSPVAALSGCRPGLIIDNLRDFGAEIKVEVVPEEGAAAMEVDATKFRSKL